MQRIHTQDQSRRKMIRFSAKESKINEYGEEGKERIGGESHEKGGR
jgi:hypothetical protein